MTSPSRTSAGKSPLPRRRTSDIAHRVARPRSGPSQNGVRGLIARGGGPQNGLGV